MDRELEHELDELDRHIRKLESLYREFLKRRAHRADVNSAKHAASPVGTVLHP